MLLQSSLGNVVRRSRATAGVERVVLPDFLGVRILNIGVGEASVDLMLERHEFDVSIRVLRRMEAARAQIAAAFSLLRLDDCTIGQSRFRNG